LAGENLAESVDADIYMVLTDVESVELDLGTDNQRSNRDITVT
jgi:carbamate kinase